MKPQVAAGTLFDSEFGAVTDAMLFDGDAVSNASEVEDEGSVGQCQLV